MDFIGDGFFILNYPSIEFFVLANISNYNRFTAFEKGMKMELYLLMAMLLVYILTAIFVSDNVQKKIWTLAFIAAFSITAVSIGFIRVSSQDVMMSANELNWYYLLYLFGSLSVVLGIINLWMYRKPILKVLFSSNSADDDDDDDDKDKE